MYPATSKFKTPFHGAAGTPGRRRSQAIAVGQYGNWPALLCVDTDKAGTVGGRLPDRVRLHAVFTPAFGN